MPRRYDVPVTDALHQTVTDATGGDPVAKEALLARFLPGLQQYLGRHAGALVRQKESIADLAQSVCREVLERLRDERFEYQGEAQFVQWLQQAAVHKLQNRHRFYRAEKRDAGREVAPRLGSDGGGVEDFAVTGATASQSAVRREVGEEVRRALERLPERDRQVIQWCHFEGKTHADVAAQLAITESHSRVLLARALARLAQVAKRPPAG